MLIFSLLDNCFFIKKNGCDFAYEKRSQLFQLSWDWGKYQFYYFLEEKLLWGTKVNMFIMWGHKAGCYYCFGAERGIIFYLVQRSHYLLCREHKGMQFYCVLGKKWAFLQSRLHNQCLEGTTMGIITIWGHNWGIITRNKGGH